MASQVVVKERKKSGPKRPHHGPNECRIEHIANMMRELKFKRGDTAKALAKEWGLQLNAVHHMTAEASKRVSKELLNPDAVKVNIGEKLLQIADEGMRFEGEPKDVAAHRKLVVEAGKVLFHLTGANAPKEYRIGAAAELTPEQKRARWLELTGTEWKDSDGVG